MPGGTSGSPRADLAGPLRDRLSEADYALGRLDRAVVTLPHPDLFVFMYFRKAAVLSSRIEGTQSSLQDLLAAHQTPRRMSVKSSEEPAEAQG